MPPRLGVATPSKMMMTPTTTASSMSVKPLLWVPERTVVSHLRPLPLRTCQWNDPCNTPGDAGRRRTYDYFWICKGGHEVDSEATTYHIHRALRCDTPVNSEVPSHLGYLAIGVDRPNNRHVSSTFVQIAMNEQGNAPHPSRNARIAPERQVTVNDNGPLHRSTGRRSRTLHVVCSTLQVLLEVLECSTRRGSDSRSRQRVRTLEVKHVVTERRDLVHPRGTPRKTAL